MTLSLSSSTAARDWPTGQNKVVLARARGFIHTPCATPSPLPPGTKKVTLPPTNLSIRVAKYYESTKKD